MPGTVAEPLKSESQTVKAAKALNSFDIAQAQFDKVA